MATFTYHICFFKEMIRSHGGNLTLRFQCQPPKPPWKQVMDLILTAKNQWDLTSKTKRFRGHVGSLWYLCGQEGNLQFEGSLVAHLKPPPKQRRTLGFPWRGYMGYMVKPL